MLWSTSVTRNPARARVLRVDRPPKPAPTTTTSGASWRGARLPVLTIRPPAVGGRTGSGSRIHLTIGLTGDGVGHVSYLWPVFVLFGGGDLGARGVRHVALRRRPAHHVPHRVARHDRATGLGLRVLLAGGCRGLMAVGVVAGRCGFVFVLVHRCFVLRVLAGRPLLRILVNLLAVGLLPVHVALPLSWRPAGSVSGAAASADGAMSAVRFRWYRPTHRSPGHCPARTPGIRSGPGTLRTLSWPSPPVRPRARSRTRERRSRGRCAGTLPERPSRWGPRSGGSSRASSPRNFAVPRLRSGLVHPACPARREVHAGLAKISVTRRRPGHGHG